MINLKEKLSSNQLTLGSWITIGHAAIAEIMSKTKYFDWLTIDMEHSALNLLQAQELITVIELNGVVPLVRVGQNSAYLIKRVMDAGAHGVIVPMVNNKEEAEHAVSSVRYPPQGSRGVGLARAQGYGFAFDEYRKWLDEKSVVVVQIEHIDAVDNICEILKVEGVDGTIIGPYDLSGSLGCPGDFSNPKMIKALNRYEEACNNMSKPMGMHIVQPELEKYRTCIRKGYKFIAVGLDTLFLGLKIKEVMGEIAHRTG